MKPLNDYNFFISNGDLIALVKARGVFPSLTRFILNSGFSHVF